MKTQAEIEAYIATMKTSLEYRAFLDERAEIKKHQWLESEKTGYDVGFEWALLDWIVKHRLQWRVDRLIKKEEETRAIQERTNGAFEAAEFTGEKL